MAISEATAMARARATRNAFPKGRISVAQARAMFVAMADSQVGYVSGNPSWSMYGKPGNWRTKWNGRQVYWCVVFGSWVAEQAFGTQAARAGFGRQVNSAAYPPVGGTWTVWVYNWARANGRVVSFNSARSGDIVLTNWGRTGAVVDHYDVVTGPRFGNLLPVIGGNTSPGNASAGAGVYQAFRPRSRVVMVVRPDWNALVAVYNANITEESDELSAAEVKEIKEAIAASEKRILAREDTHRRERTNAHVKQMKMLETISTQLNTVGRIAREAREGVKAVPAAVAAFRVPFIKGTSSYKTFGSHFRVGALWAYGAQAFYRRGEHTEEIVEALEYALDTDALESQMHALHAEGQEDQEEAQEAAGAVQRIMAQDAEDEALVAADVAVEQA